VSVRKLLDYNPDTGVSHVFHWDNETERSTIVAEQDVDKILDANRAQANDQGKRFAKSGFTKVASVPIGVYAEMKRAGILDDAKALKRWLNDPDNRFFRTHEAHI
jgi:hypothetical protein